MLMADTMSIFFVILGMMLALPGLWLLCRGLWPEAVAATAERCRRNLWSSFLVGLPITIMMIVATRILFSVLGPVGKFAAVSLVCLYMLQAHAGVAGLATSIGRRLLSPIDEQRPWRATLRGGVILELTYLLPILGWFVILPASIIIGSGAANLTLLSRMKLTLVGNHPGLTGPNSATTDHTGGSIGVV